MDGIAADEETLKILGTLIMKISCQVYSIMQLAGQVNFKAVTNDPGALNRRSDSITLFSFFNLLSSSFCMGLELRSCK
jgi:hypothetical protein